MQVASFEKFHTYSFSRETSFEEIKKKEKKIFLCSFLYKSRLLDLHVFFVF